MPTAAPEEFNRLLEAVSRGDEAATVDLVPKVYDELRRLARRYLRRERAGHTLQATALVHEALLRLFGPQEGVACDRTSFFALAATAMRRILVNHAKARGRYKRGGGAARVPMHEGTAVFEDRAIDLIALDEALTRLGEIDPQQAHIVELRFFAGLSVEETATMLDVSERTVHRDWAMARAWLRGEIEKGDEDAAGA